MAKEPPGRRCPKPADALPAPKTVLPGGSPGIDTAGVLVLTSSFPHGGNPVNGIFVRDFASSVCGRVRTVVLCPRFPGPPPAEDAGFRICCFSQVCPPGFPLAGNPGGILPALKKHPFLWAFLPFFLLSELTALIRTVRRENITVIHAHWLVPQGFVAAVYKRFVNPCVRLLITCHGSDINKAGGGLLNLLKRFSLGQADRVVAVSADLAEKVRALRPGTSCAVRAMGIDTTLFSPAAAEERPTLSEEFRLRSAPVLFVGSLIELKGVRELVAAWRIVLDRRPDAELLIVGGGGLRTELETTARELKVDARVHFAGPVAHEKLPRYFAQSAAFILPSHSEGFGLVVGEALSCETPVIVSKIPVFEAMPGAEGLFTFCTPRDPQSIADAVIRVLGDPARCKCGRQYVREHLSLQQTADWYLALYSGENAGEDCP